jgi:molybdopterin-guanine dinucleotide biosynthesis protein A
MGGNDKGLLALNGVPMVEHVLRVLRPQVSDVLISANRNESRYAAFGCRVLGDSESGYLGPLAGMLSGMLAASTPWLVSVPCDSPLLPGDLVARLHAGLATAGARVAVAHDGDRLQPVFALLDVTLRDDLQAFLAAGERKIDRWYAKHACAEVDFSDAPEAFRNVNTPEDKQALEAVLRDARQ